MIMLKNPLDHAYLKLLLPVASLLLTVYLAFLLLHLRGELTRMTVLNVTLVTQLQSMQIADRAQCFATEHDWSQVQFVDGMYRCVRITISPKGSI